MKNINTPGRLLTNQRNPNNYYTNYSKFLLTEANGPKPANMAKSMYGGTNSNLRYYDPNPKKNPNMSKSTTFGPVPGRSQRDTFGPTQQPTFEEIAKMKRSHGPLGRGNNNVDLFGNKLKGLNFVQGDNAAYSGKYAKNVNQFTEYMKEKQSRNTKKSVNNNARSSKSMRNMRSTVGAVQSRAQNEFNTGLARDTRMSTGVPSKMAKSFIQGQEEDLTKSFVANTPPQSITPMPPQNKAQFQTKLDKFDLTQSQSPHLKNDAPAIYKSSKNQPYMDKIVQGEYTRRSGSRRASVAQSPNKATNRMITNFKVDYKDFGTYVEDCKQHLKIANDLNNYRNANNVKPTTTFDVDKEVGKRKSDFRAEWQPEEIVAVGFG